MMGEEGRMERAQGTSKVAMMGSGRVQRLLCHACHMMVPLYARCQVMVPVRRKECAAAICKCLILHERIARLCFRLLPIYGLSHMRHAVCICHDQTSHEHARSEG